MEALCGVMFIALAFVGMFVTGILASSRNRCILAAWLIATARAMDERRAAAQGIEEERRLYQKKLEDQLSPGKSLEVIR